MKVEKCAVSRDFVVPVILENMVTLAVGLVFSQIISTISESALAATGMANTVMAVAFAAFAIVITGSAVVVSRQTGEGDLCGAGDTIERTGGVSLLISIAATVALIAGSSGLMRLLMPTAEEGFFREALRYFRVLMLSLPLYVTHSVFAGVCRAMGDTKRPMRAYVLMNLSQLVFAWIFIRVFGLEELGAALTYICCRMVGLVLTAFALHKNRHGVPIHFKRMLRLAGGSAVIKRVLHVGAPVSLSNTIVQVGYLLINSIAVSLGSFACGVYQILTTVNALIGIPQGICSTIALPVVGNLLGAKRVKEAKRTGIGIWVIGICASIALGLIVWLNRGAICGWYSSNTDMAAESARILWILIIMDIAGVAINAMDPQLQAGGDVRFVMLYTIIAVWLVRLPLSWYFSYRLHYGVMGLFAANTISLYLRAIIGLIRHGGSRWYARKV
ncbi:MAG: MATE family efflux transporter [Clostridiaceae bacterium]|nr:MATE family efflux transporter [Clostridiaceae bacterium]